MQATGITACRWKRTLAWAPRPLRLSASRPIQQGVRLTSELPIIAEMAVKGPDDGLAVEFTHPDHRGVGQRHRGVGMFLSRPTRKSLWAWASRATRRPPSIQNSSKAARDLRRGERRKKTSPRITSEVSRGSTIRPRQPFAQVWNPSPRSKRATRGPVSAITGRFTFQSLVGGRGWWKDLPVRG